jgi:hypothetical protein
VNILSIPQIVLSGDEFAPAVVYISGNRSDIIENSASRYQTCLYE